MKENKQVSRSREWIFDALIFLMKNKEFNEISISEIATKAGVARLTFYRNYISKEDILIKRTSEIYGELMIELEKIGEGNDVIYLSINKIISAFNDYAYIFELLLKNNLDYLIMQSFESEISNILSEIFDVDSKNRYSVKFYEGALFSIAVEWIKNSREESVNELTDIIFDLVQNKRKQERK